MSDGPAQATAALDSEAVVLPDALDSPRSKCVYLSVLHLDGATPEQLRATLDIPLLTLYPVLATLERASLVTREGDEYRLAEQAG
jgi:predicted transcriptional regulator